MGQRDPAPSAHPIARAAARWRTAIARAETAWESGVGQGALRRPVAALDGLGPGRGSGGRTAPHA